jgi:translation elongation factor P/translation initiation factor 5A
MQITALDVEIGDKLVIVGVEYLVQDSEVHDRGNGVADGMVRLTIVGLDDTPFSKTFKHDKKLDVVRTRKVKP